jgi:hypothetical protein
VDAKQARNSHKPMTRMWQPDTQDRWSVCIYAYRGGQFGAGACWCRVCTTHCRWQKQAQGAGRVESACMFMHSSRSTENGRRCHLLKVLTHRMMIRYSCNSSTQTARLSASPIVETYCCCCCCRWYWCLEEALCSILFCAVSIQDACNGLTECVPLPSQLHMLRCWMRLQGQAVATPD